MIQSLATLEQTKHPIQVTKPYIEEELWGWKLWFKQRGISIKLIPENETNKVTLWRAITKEELEEIKSGKLYIRYNTLTTDKTVH